LAEKDGLICNFCSDNQLGYFGVFIYAASIYKKNFPAFSVGIKFARPLTKVVLNGLIGTKNCFLSGLRQKTKQQAA